MTIARTMLIAGAIAFLPSAATILSPGQAAAQVQTAVTVDPPRDAAHPPAMAALVIPSGDGGMNALLYTTAGAGPHPTLVFFHGFPGNEQELDLAQAARRAGWNMLTLHYRGSWGSPGRFSFAHCTEDADAALAWLRAPATVARFAIDPARIAVAGHSMGGMMAASAVAGDSRVVGAFLIDPWDIAHDAKTLADPAKLAAFKRDELAGDMPPLAGTTEDALIAEIMSASPRINLAATMPKLADRPLTIVYAEFGVGDAEKHRIEIAARAAHPKRLELTTWPTDHPFSDRRIALASALVAWLHQFEAGR